MSSSGSVLELILVSPDGFFQGSLLGIPVGGRANKAGEKLTQCTHVYRVGIIAATSLKSPAPKGREVICLETRGEGEAASGVRRRRRRASSHSGAEALIESDDWTTDVTARFGRWASARRDHLVIEVPNALTLLVS